MYVSLETSVVSMLCLSNMAIGLFRGIDMLHGY